MAAESEISWTDATWNPWIGCTKVGPACDGCYAERDNALRKWVTGWGAGIPRRRTKTWGDPGRWHRAAGAWFAAHGRRRRVFAASLADWLDNEVPDEWHRDAWDVVRDCFDLDWYIVTKRIPNFEKMKPADWCEEKYRHVVLIVTVANQSEFNRDVPRLQAIKSAYPWLRIGLSIEPLLGPIDMEYPVEMYPEGPRMCCSGFECGCQGQPIDPPLCWHLDWVIVGGESGSDNEVLRSRPVQPLNPHWVRSLRDQCEKYRIPFHFKQWGEYRAEIDAFDMRSLDVWVSEKDGRVGTEDEAIADGGSWTGMYRLGKKKTGRSIDGQTHDGSPRELD